MCIRDRDDGKVYAMLGPNGSGKTTLMKMIAGLIKPTSGTITMDGKMLDTKSKAHIAYMPTESYFYPYMTVKDIVAFYKDFYKDFSEPVFYDLLARMGLQFGDKVKNMSTGMLAKLKIAVALSRDAGLIMLDEMCIRDRYSLYAGFKLILHAVGSNFLNLFRGKSVTECLGIML